ncbi:MAG: glycosyltransferase family 2 protein [Vicinamibacterales bacterium]
MTSPRRRISVVIPVYYNEESLPPLFNELVAIEGELGKRGLDLEVIFVDDGSRDGSLAQLLVFKQRRPDTRIVKLTRNFGAVHASKTGFRYVTGDAFMILAADLQDPPALILELADRWLAGAKYVVCAREARDDPWPSRAFAAIYYRLVRQLVISDYPMGGYDLALMDRAMLSHMVDSAKNINTPLFAYWLGFEPHVVRYTREKRRSGSSRWTLAKRITFFLDSLLGFSIVPIRLISLVGLMVSALSFAYGAWMVINGLLNRVPVPGFATIVALMAFLLGLVIVMLGVLGEYLWRVFDEVGRRPETVIETVY